MNKIKNRSVKAAFGGIIAALSIVLMFMTGVIPVLTYAVPAICGAILMVAVIEIGAGFAFTVYFAVSLLSLFVVADKEAAVMYAIFFGYYPIIKGFLEKHIKKVACWIVKFLIFNVTMIGAYFIVSKVFGIPYDDIDWFGDYVLLVLLAMGNVVFGLYDIALTRLVSAYIFKWQKFVKRLFK